jgi:16S rRNA (cytosine1402-N4)-methyltransferase
MVPTLDLPAQDIIFADLGLSSPHIDDAARGFTFRADGPLDLRYDQSTGDPASYLLQHSSPEKLATIFRSYGELHREGGKLGRLLAGSSLTTTLQVRDRVEEAFGFRARDLHPRIFQALRIAVNEELSVLDVLLAAAPELLAPGGRFGVISYHSLEDRAVKHAFRALTTPSKDPVTGKISVPASYELLTKKAIVPSDAEMEENPRARSAKFRILRRLPS